MDQQLPTQTTHIKNSQLGQLSTLSFPPSYQIHYYKNPILLNKQYTKDIQPGIYQGGFQLWQCEIEFLKKIFQLQELTSMFTDKRVIEIGCGHGLLAVAAAKLGAKIVIAQDYNQNVIHELTQPTIAVNNIHSQVEYLWGDWDTMKRQQNEKYDIILGSELTYKEQNYEKIINFINNNMKPNGKCVLANKSYYFGVGGNMAGFLQKVQERGLQWRTVCKIVPKSGGNKKEIVEIEFKKM